MSAGHQIEYLLDNGQDFVLRFQIKNLASQRRWHSLRLAGLGWAF